MTGVALLFAAVQIASAQPSTTEGKPVPHSVASRASREPGSNLTVSLLTMGPGDQVWEKFGHNAIWIHDDANGTDIAYHWGLFDFADKDFVPRFIQGRMRYSMGAFDMEQTVDAYRRTNRTVWVQELNLTPAERRKLADFVAWNILPENRYYAYDYYRDNCSTRVRDALDNALGGLIERASDSVPSGTTYRFHTSRLTQDDWPVFTGTMIGLGQPTDKPISAWEEMFLPVRMMNRLRAVMVQTPRGAEPLVRSERVLVQATRPAEDSSVHRGMPGYLAIAGGILVLGVGLLALRRREGGGAGVLALATLWSVIAGVGGTLLAFLWGFTDHRYSYRNENLFQMNPLSLLLAIFLIRAISQRWRTGADAAEPSRRDAFRFAVIVAGISVLGFILQVIPGLDQVNGDVIALAMPLHLGVVALLLALRPELPGKSVSA